MESRNKFKVFFFSAFACSITRRLWLHRLIKSLCIYLFLSVWPDAEIKSIPKFSKCCQNSLFPEMGCFQNSSKVTIHKVAQTFVTKIFTQNFEKSPNLVTLIYLSFSLSLSLVHPRQHKWSQGKNDKLWDKDLLVIPSGGVYVFK